MRVRRETVLPADAARVWEALTDEEQLSHWFGEDVSIDPRPDGAAEFRGPEGTRRARVDRVEPERRLSWQWRDDGEDAGRVEFVLVPVPGGTHLTVTETPGGAVATVSWGLRLDAFASMVSAASALRTPALV